LEDAQPLMAVSLCPSGHKEDGPAPRQEQSHVCAGQRTIVEGMPIHWKTILPAPEVESREMWGTHRTASRELFQQAHFTIRPRSLPYSRDAIVATQFGTIRAEAGDILDNSVASVCMPTADPRGVLPVLVLFLDKDHRPG